MMNEKDLENMFGLPYLQSLVDTDLKTNGYITPLTLVYIGNFGNIVLDKNFKVIEKR